MNTFNKMMKRFNSLDTWVQYLLVISIVVILVSLLWPSPKTGVRLVPVKGTSYYQGVLENFSDEDKLNNAISSDKPAFVAFVAEWCGYCKKLKPAWKEFEDNYSGKECNVLTVECTKHKELAKKHGVTGYPTIKYLPKGLSDPSGAIDYDGKRTPEGFSKFLEQYNL